MQTLLKPNVKKNCQYIKKNAQEAWKIAGFWIRLLSRLIDLIIVWAIATFLSWLFLIKKHFNNQSLWAFKMDYLFYIYVLIVIGLISFFFIIMPLIFNGQTIGNMLTRTKIVRQINDRPTNDQETNDQLNFNFKNRKSLLTAIFKREIFWSISWIFCALLMMVIINHTLIIKFAMINKNNFKFSNWQTFRISLMSAIASLIVFTQMICAISILVRKDNKGLHDIYSQSMIIYCKSRLIKIDDNQLSLQNIDLLKPQKIKQYQIDFVD